jgi:putative transposase
MPRHPTRYYGSGDLHFITAGCYRRRPLLATPARRDLFLDELEQMRRRYRFAVLGYVVMPEHFHLLVSEPQRMTLSTVVQGPKLGRTNARSLDCALPSLRERKATLGMTVGWMDTTSPP